MSGVATGLPLFGNTGKEGKEECEGGKDVGGLSTAAGTTVAAGGGIARLQRAQRLNLVG